MTEIDVTALRHPLEVYSDIRNHQIENPTHGANCICMDKYAREMRTILGFTKYEQIKHEAVMKDVDYERRDPNLTGSAFTQFLKSDEYKSYTRWSYVLRMATRDR